MRIIVLISWCFLLIIGCNTTKKAGKDPCVEYDNIMREFASKFEYLPNNCIKYHFEKDSTKYILYNELEGKTNFMDYRFNELFYYQDKLTDDFLDLSRQSKECLMNLNKRDIEKIFGYPTVKNSYYNEYFYYIVLNNSCGFCTGDEFKLGDCANYIRIDFDGKDGRVKGLLINIYDL